MNNSLLNTINKMITAKNLNLDINNFFVGVTSTGEKVKYHFESGDIVILQKGEVQIRVQNAIKQRDGSIIGTVQFDASDQAAESLGINTGTKIMFCSEHIFRISKK